MSSSCTLKAWICWITKVNVAKSLTSNFNNRSQNGYTYITSLMPDCRKKTQLLLIQSVQSKCRHCYMTGTEKKTRDQCETWCASVFGGWKKKVGTTLLSLTYYVDRPKSFYFIQRDLSLTKILIYCYFLVRFQTLGWKPWYWLS